MAQHGGARTPANPAPVSGPGALSRRTDGKQPVVVAPGGDYGDATDLTQLQSAEPLPDGSSAGPVQGGQGQSIQSAMNGVTPLDADSQYPDIPVTDGAASGAGAGPEALGIPQTPAGTAALDAAKLPPALIHSMMLQSMDPNSSDAFKQFVRNLVGATAVSNPTAGQETT